LHPRKRRRAERGWQLYQSRVPCPEQIPAHFHSWLLLKLVDLDMPGFRRLALADAHAQEAVAVARFYLRRVRVIGQADDTPKWPREAFVGVNGGAFLASWQ